MFILINWELLKGVVWSKMVKIIKFLFFAQKVSSGMGASHPKFLGTSSTRTPPPKKKWRERGGGQRGGGGRFFSFSIGNEKENGKNILYIL